MTERLTCGDSVCLWWPEEFASAAVFICSPQASYLTGITVAVDGGSTQH